MNCEEIIEFAVRMGLHCDHDDDPDSEETIFLWHDADLESDGGLLIRFQQGQSYIVDPPASRKASRRLRKNSVGDPVLHRITEYVELCRRLPAPTYATPELLPIEQARSDPSHSREEDWRPRLQKKEGEFKAVDPLGHFYYVEIFRDISAKREEGQTRRLVTVEGESVERVAKGLYRLEQARVDLSSDDPAAP